ncbi:thioesterase, partial [Candidatus Bipolaricaulota bacterium]|nr:thioesterase [Candidatus Bipolaricaulota bacterium]
GQQTVGTRVTVEHLAATPVGMKVTVQSKLVGIDGRRLVFEVEANDERDLVARCEHQRFIIDEAQFVARIAEKARSK